MQSQYAASSSNSSDPSIDSFITKDNLSVNNCDAVNEGFNGNVNAFYENVNTLNESFDDYSKDKVEEQLLNIRRQKHLEYNRLSNKIENNDSEKN